ncbi:acyl-CoA N-acyltransferase [Gigaspora rosea]|uniref:Ornithine decarboxylase antizyme n=1 Tax=Gigaspora rosea TaxID=44941 RepID=A0A397UBZ2_9GLOM|nr:acyl-CoA N-acyltransferase [Gigaspora rosea]
MAGNMNNMIQMKDMSSSSFSTTTVLPREQLLIACLTKKTSTAASKRECYYYSTLAKKAGWCSYEQGFLTRDSGSFAVLGSLWWRKTGNDDDNIYKPPIKIKKKTSSFIEQVFRGPAQIDSHLTIFSPQQHDCKWEGFVMNSVLFLKGNGVVELKESIVAILELAEECLKCDSLVVCLDKKYPQLSTLIRSFLYVGFELVLPGTFNHLNDDFLLVGIEL